jgi:replicative DNA helicase
VDYVQLLADQQGDGRSRERGNVSAAAKGLKNVSGEFGVPVLALVQLNRNRAARADKAANADDLREQGAAERIEHALLDEGVDARAADTEPASGFDRRPTVIDELV